MKSMKMVQRAQQGFTLIELMIVVAIIGILAAVAIPQYQNYTVKAKMANALTSVESLKTAVALCIQEAGGVDSACDTTAAGAETTIPAFTATKEVASATVADGTITVTMASGIATGVDGLAFTLDPTANDTGINWEFGGTGTTITHTEALAALRKNNIAAASAGTGT